MKRNLKRTLAMLLAIIMIGGVAPLAGLANWFSIKTAAVDYLAGDTVYYGTYPQSDVTGTLGYILSSKGGTWKSYNYYSGTGDWADGKMKPSDYMRYKDVVYGGKTYRGVTFDSYRPYSTGYTSDYNNQQGNGYYTGRVYWFRFDPIKWKVLDPSTGLIMCDSAIDSQAYNNFVISNGTDEHQKTAYWGDPQNTYYANNYAQSSLRKWLNEDFYNTAFSAKQKENVKTAELNNDGYYTLNEIAGYEDYDAPSTSDKVFVLSYDEIQNSAYGFNSSASAYDQARKLKSSDYAKCQGLWVYNGYSGSASWWLRSPGDGTHSACYIAGDGDCSNGYGISGTHRGIVPAMYLDSLISDTTDTNIYNLGEETYSFINYGDYHGYEEVGGHCFGMAVTSSGYYLGYLEKSIIGGNDDTPLYSFELSDIVKKPICHYFEIQGSEPDGRVSAELEAIVAGGSCDLTRRIDIASDWQECINYVKNHENDNKGILNVGTWGEYYSEGSVIPYGHAVNFLYYKEVDGQQRIYIYDNNWPKMELYYYMGNDGFVHVRSDYAEYNEYLAYEYGDVYGIDLMDVNIYFPLADNYVPYYSIYANKNEILVKGAEMSYLKCGVVESNYVKFAFPENAKEIEIVPLVDNASFKYDNETYSFGEIESGTVGYLQVKTEESGEGRTDFDIVTPVESGKIQSVSVSDLYIKYKKSAKLNPVIKAEPGTVYDVMYISSNPDVVSVDGNGIVTGLNKGTATITVVVADDQGNVVTDTCKVTVRLAFWQWFIKIFLFGWIWPWY